LSISLEQTAGIRQQLPPIQLIEPLLSLFRNDIGKDGGPNMFCPEATVKEMKGIGSEGTEDVHAMRNIFELCVERFV